MARPLIDVPAAVAQTAAAALAERARREGGGTARGVVIATALAGGHLTPGEFAEVHSWHGRNLEQVREGRSTLLGGLYGGVPGRSWLGAVAAARNPEGRGAMIALPIGADVAKAIARDDGEPPSAMHLTLFHLAGDAAELDPALRERYLDVVAAMEGPTVELTHIERFTATDEGLEPVTVVSDTPDVYGLRSIMEEALDAAGLPYSDDHAFRAHVTIGYYAPGDGPEPGPLPEPLIVQPAGVELHWGTDVATVPFAPAAVAAVAAARDADGYYVVLDGHPVSGPHPTRGDADSDREPGEHVVYLAAVTAAAPPAAREKRYRRLAAGTRRIDERLARNVRAAAEHALREALRSAGVKLTQTARSRGKVAVLDAAGGYATPVVLAALNLEQHRLIEHRLDALGTLFQQWAAAAEREKLALARRLMADDVEDDDWNDDMLEARYGAEIDRRASLAAGLLVAGLGWLALRRLGGPDDATLGEVSGDVPFGLLRGPLDLVRTGTEPPLTFDPLSPDAPTPVATTPRGPSIPEQLASEHGVRMRGTARWVHGYYGEPSTAFDPHLALGDVDWAAEPMYELDDPRLAKDPGDWPYGSHYWPGDHAGCTCEIVYDLDPDDGALGLAASASDAPGRSPDALARVLARAARPDG